MFIITFAFFVVDSIKLETLAKKGTGDKVKVLTNLPIAFVIYLYMTCNVNKQIHDKHVLEYSLVHTCTDKTHFIISLVIVTTMGINHNKYIPKNFLITYFKQFNQ